VIYSECIIDDVDEEEKEEQEDGGCVCFWLCIILANNFIQIISPMTYPIKNHPIKNHHIPSYSHDISPFYHHDISPLWHDITFLWHDSLQLNPHPELHATQGASCRGPLMALSRTVAMSWCGARWDHLSTHVEKYMEIYESIYVYI